MEKLVFAFTFLHYNFFIIYPKCAFLFGKIYNRNLYSTFFSVDLAQYVLRKICSSTTYKTAASSKVICPVSALIVALAPIGMVNLFSICPIIVP